MRGGGQKSVIDNIMTDLDTFNLVQGMTVDEQGEWDIGSDHNMTWVDISIQKSNRQSMATPWTKRKWKMEIGTDWSKYRECIERRLMGWSPQKWIEYSEEDMAKQVEEVVEEFSNVIIAAADEALGRKKANGKRKNPISDESVQAIKERKKACKGWKNSVKEQRCTEVVQECWQVYKECKEKVRGIKIKEKRRWNSRMMEKISSKGCGAKSFWQYWNNMNYRKGTTQTIRSDKGRLSETKEIAEEIASHWERLYKPYETEQEEPEEHSTGPTPEEGAEIRVG